MNRNFRYGVGLLLGTFLAGVAVAADLPRLGAVYYGRILNAYAYPCQSGDGVRLSVRKTDGTEVGYYTVGSVIGPDVNYRLQIDCVASGSGVNGLSVPDGGAVQIQATLGGHPVNLIGDTNVVVSSGAVVKRTFIVGADSNHNGIPDEWEQFVINAMFALGMPGGATNVSQFDAEADYDGDGANNRQEFLAGTLPFLTSDSLRIVEFDHAGDGTCRLRFLGNQGFNYQVRTSSESLTGAWQVVQFGTNVLSPSAQNVVEGAGVHQDVYVFPTNGFRQFFGLSVK